MKLRGFMTTVLLAAALTTNTVGRVANADPDTEVAPDPSVVAVPTTFPAHVPSPDDPVIAVVTLTPNRPRAAAHHGLSPAAYGLFIGALGGAVLGSANDNDVRTRMDPDSCRCAVLPGVLLGGLIGLGVGALVGALSGPGDGS